MKRYIDAEKLKNKINAYVITTQDVAFIKQLIDETEPADVAPVFHAYWEQIESMLHVEKSGACSRCGEVWPISDTEYFYYCPNCGAKMDEEMSK